MQVRGVHLLAGMLLMNMNVAVAFICLRNLLDRPCLRAFYCGIDEEVEAYYRVRPGHNPCNGSFSLTQLFHVDIRQLAGRPVS